MPFLSDAFRVEAPLNHNAVEKKTKPEVDTKGTETKRTSTKATPWPSTPTPRNAPKAPPRTRIKSSRAYTASTPSWRPSSTRPKTQRPRATNSGSPGPRARGEHRGERGARACMEDSPPRMRGAPAGTPGSGSGGWAHPRACGEHLPGGPEEPPMGGSPPRMRGAPARRSGGAPDGGLTPAHAGSTMRRYGALESARAHPRTCGEHSPRLARVSVSRGSPPHMRGAPPRPGRPRPDHRLTPAHAGSTLHELQRCRALSKLDVFDGSPCPRLSSVEVNGSSGMIAVPECGQRRIGRITSQTDGAATTGESDRASAPGPPPPCR